MCYKYELKVIVYSVHDTKCFNTVSFKKPITCKFIRTSYF